MESCSRVTGFEKQGAAWLLHTESADIKLQFVTEEIVRVRAAFDKCFAEESYVLAASYWEDRLDGLFQGERSRLTPPAVTVEETERVLVFTTAALRLVVEKEPLCVKLQDAEGTELYSSLAGKSFLRDGNGRVSAFSRMEEDDCFYGFGEKGGVLNKNKRFLRERATDAMGYDPETADTLYKHIPFYIRLDRRSRKAVGVFYHNFYESVFNMGCEKSNYWPRYSYWQADGGDVDLFLIGGNRIARIVDNYTLLTGRPALLPKRALGYQASSMYYAELEKDCDKEILGFVDTVKAEGFPIDGFHLSSGYTAQGGKRCVFTWNGERFSDPEGFFAEMNGLGAQAVPNVKPGVLKTHPDYQSFAAERVFVKDSSGDGRPAVGSWWGGDGAFWDFTSPEARTAWKKHLTEQVLSKGTESVWNDNCEYDSLTDTDALCDFDGKGGMIAALKPHMSSLMCKLACDAIGEHKPGARPYVVCRSGCAGIQKYAQTWCGDNRSDWESFKYSIPIIAGMGLSGQPNEGADIGGFAGPAPEEELLLRWVQSGVFQPRFSIHSASSDNTVTEPWMYGNVTEYIRKAMLLRYRLTPYLYSAEYEAHVSGAPLLRALVYEFQNDPKVYDESFDFLCGRSLLVAGVMEKGVEKRRVYLPKGCKWYLLDESYTCFKGGQTVEVPVSLERIPVFLREDGVVPLADNQLYSMQNDKVTALRLLLAPGEGSRYTMYDDDGVSNACADGEYRKTEITVQGGSVVQVDFKGSGSYTDTVETVSLECIRKERSPYWVTLNGERLPHYLNRRQFEAAETGWYYSMTKRAALVKYPNPRQDSTLRISFEDFDLIGMDGSEEDN